MKTIKAKTILHKVKNAPDRYFGLTYNMNLYRGCQHGCIYCDVRSECYGIDELGDIHMKENALSLLPKELKSKRLKGTIGFGSMHDPYMPVEKKYELTRKGLALVNQYRFPVHILTKGKLVTRDIDLLQEAGKIYCCVSISLSTPHDDTARKTEPGAPNITERLNTIKTLTKQGIYAGIILMPFLPFIDDTAEDVKTLVEKAYDAGARYIFPWFGMTLRDRQKAFYFKKLDQSFPGLRKRYVETFKNQYACLHPQANLLYQTFKEHCQKYKIPTQIAFYQPETSQQLSLFK